MTEACDKEGLPRRSLDQTKMLVNVVASLHKIQIAAKSSCNSSKKPLICERHQPSWTNASHTCLGGFSELSGGLRATFGDWSGCIRQGNFADFWDGRNQLSQQYL